MTLPLYPGDRVLIAYEWAERCFHGARGTVVAGAPPGRVAVHVDGDKGPTLFFDGEVKPLEDE